MTEVDLAKTLEGLSAAATQGACEVLAPDTEHDFGVPIVATDYPGTYGPTNGLVLWATMQPTEIDAKDTTRAQANAAFTSALWNAYRTGQLIVVDHPQATSPVGDHQMVEAADREAASRYYGFDDEKHLTCWEQPSRHAQVERLAVAFARHRQAALTAARAQVKAENQRLREALGHYAKDYDYERKCSQWDGGAIARQALGDEA